MGAYARYENAGAYVDASVQYAWFNNEVSSADLPTENYDSAVWLTSIETGYAFTLAEIGSRQWLIEPQAQIIYNTYHAGQHVEHNGTRVDGTDSDGLTTRLGVRLFSRPTTIGVQPFIETNWWHDETGNSLLFDSQRCVNSAFLSIWALSGHRAARS